MPPMPGMASETDMTQMMNMHGPDFDRMFLQMMIRHHQGAVEMARTEQTHGINPDAKALAHTIDTSQTTEISQMQQLLGTIPSHRHPTYPPEPAASPSRRTVACRLTSCPRRVSATLLGPRSSTASRDLVGLTRKAASLPRTSLDQPPS